MQQIIIEKNQSGQRFDKFLFKYFKDATSGFIYKMLRKKNITLNNKKSDGKEKLKENDIVKIFMADETIEKFRGLFQIELPEPINLDIVYEDENVIFINKRTGMLSQKSKENDVSLNEYVISYLVNEGKLSIEDLKTFKPSVCNRLDRNTSGLIVAGKSLQGLQDMSKMFKERTLHKYYLAVVVGTINEPMKITGYLKKNNKTNKVIITNKTDGEYIETYYEPVKVLDDVTLLKVQLITGKTHQIRAHLSSINHPIIGDYKYGKKEINDIYKKKHGIENQMLHSYQLTFETINGELGNLSNKTFIAKPPKEFAEITGFRQKKE